MTLATGGVEFGVILPIGRRMELAGVEGAEAKWEVTRRTARRAEELGYDSVWVYDHLHNVHRPQHEAVFECWVTLAALSQCTSRVRLGHLVGNNLFRPPALVAKMAATLDVASGGRLDVGIGTGWDAGELEAYGYRLPPARERIEMLAEAVTLMRALWTEPDVTFEGRHYRLAGAQCDPKPVQRPHPPLWIGGAGERVMLRLVARLADRSNFGGSPDEWARRNEVLTRHCVEVGRDPATLVRTWSHDAFLREDERDVLDPRLRGLWGESADVWRRDNLVGTPDQVVEKVGRYVAAGCRAFVVWCADAPSDETLELFAKHVVTAFR